jgi:hypothetical protein
MDPYLASILGKATGQAVGCRLVFEMAEFLFARNSVTDKRNARCQASGTRCYYRAAEPGLRRLMPDTQHHPWCL